MTLTLTTTPDLAPEARRIEGVLRAYGTVVSVVGLDASHGAAPDGGAVAALRSGRARAAVVRASAMLHLPDDLRVVAVLGREEPRDVVVPAGGAAFTLQTLPAGARVGVADARRRGFLRASRPDVEALHPGDLGNGEGPAAALHAGGVAAVILGSTEARRLALRARASEILDPKAWVPGPGQGTVLVVADHDDTEAKEAFRPADEGNARSAWLAESSVLAAQGLAADAPIGVMALPHGKWIRVWGMVASDDGTRVVRGDVTGGADDPEAAGRTLAELLVARGAALVLRRGGS